VTDLQQLEQTAPETIETGEDAEVDDDEDMEDDNVDDEEEDESESEEDEEELEEEEEDDASLKVDPEFRRRVAEALQVSGMGVDDDAEEGDSDDESDGEVWDDDKMMLVDEQLAEVFRQRANAGKSSDFKRTCWLPRRVRCLLQTCTFSPFTSKHVSSTSSMFSREDNSTTLPSFTLWFLCSDSSHPPHRLRRTCRTKRPVFSDPD